MRLLPRLIKRLSKNPPSLSPELDKLQAQCTKYTKSLYKPLPPRFSVDPAHHAVSPVLADYSPFTHKSDFVRHKRLPPVPRLSRRRNTKRDAIVDDARDASARPTRETSVDPSREMTREERDWFASPYLRMLASPLRKCAVTGRYMPSDFLIRLLPMKLPVSRASRIRAIIVPDGLQHPRFESKRRGKAGYITCWAEVLAQAPQRGTAGKIMHGGGIISPVLLEQTLHLLRVRVLQELEVLRLSLKREHPRRREGCTSPIVRRLTRAELARVRESDTIPYPDAIAVLMCPPVNRNPSTRARPDGEMSAFPPSEAGMTTKAARPPPPHSTLHPVAPIEPTPEGIEPHAPHLIPLYHSLALFPHPAHRRKLHELLSAIIARERTIRPPSNDSPAEVDSKQRKASHAYLITSNAETVGRGIDVAALGIALWRLRMLSGGGWNFGGQNTAEADGKILKGRDGWTDPREMEGSRWCRTKW
ncbi:hypothetical protein K523DRAFT_418234 [Schizophyllum commune Tattone D]|nr:hypothetical protein K523DRAFT_418234 [Schizophyllum commune Tattone D]